MRIIRVIISYKLKSVIEFIDFCLHVIKCMTLNPKFPTPDVSMTELSTSVKVLQDKHDAALNGNKEAKEGVKVARKATERLMRLNGLYVDKIANGDPEIIASSGYEASKQPVPAIRPDFSVSVGAEAGEIVLIRKAVRNAASYVWQFVPHPIPQDEKLWVLAGVSTQARCVIQNLDSGSKYWFRVAAVTPLGKLPWCEPIMKVVP
jgi:hypothetical protein